MLGKIAILLAALSTATAEYGCSSFAQLTHTASGCPANQGNPDCSFIQANAQQFCSTTASSWEIINGPNCNLRGASYGCIFAAGLYSTTDQFCCPLIVVGAANSSATPSASASASASALASVSPSASASNIATSSPSSSASASVSASTIATFSSSVSAGVTVSSVATFTATSSATSTSSSTATGTFTALPSTNITVIYVTTTDTSISQGQAAAIGFSAIFGFLVLCGCCGFIFLRKRPVKSDEIVRKVTIAERRKSALELRTANLSTV